MNKRLLFFICLLLCVQLSVAQTLQGIITDQEARPIAEAQIFNQTQLDHTHSDDLGQFTLSVRQGDTLKITHLGYETKTHIIRNPQQSLEFILTEKAISLEEVIIAPHIDALKLVAEVDIQTQPINSSQDILKQVPGLFIGQHAGGGKAEQIFLRGFDIDHGTDVAISADGLPVNMVSHAHGQGYSDLHFLIPETLEAIDYGKGPYEGSEGNFNTAGYVNFNTKRSLNQSLLKLETGEFNTQRLLGMFQLVDNATQQSYVASEYLKTDGSFESPQNFSRLNLFGKYTTQLTEADQLGITLSHFTSTWDASGQIPQRAVDSRQITRFGAIDDTEGGTTQRSNVLINYNTFLNNSASLKNRVFYSHYDFELYSNFTFFLEDPENGDQIRQKESRHIFGLSSEYKRPFETPSFDGIWEAGISLRNDRSTDNELSRSLNRQTTLERIQFGDINETNFSAYLSADLNWGKWRLNPSVRLDYFDFQYVDKLLPTYETKSLTKSIVSPRLKVLYQPSESVQLFAKAGKGFHSNDTRVVVAQQGEDILPAAYGYDLGLIWKPLPKLVVNTAFWHLFLEQEFVYVGDAGIVEPSGKTRRRGIDLGIRYEPLPQLFLNLDANYAHARSTEAPDGEDFIPLAPDLTITSGLNYKHRSGFYAGLNGRYIKDRPANEDNSIIAEGYTVFDLNLGMDWERFSIGLEIQNLLDTDWNETQFATESRLQNELTPVEEIHFTPGTPFFLKGSLTYRF